ncbi:BTAD domain-containing putative transcriptional regulator [Arthrobacter sp. B2I5]|uniref:AfsR/SARP family transcriptional regulator n=1 Tax=Arthrobacter sp. B2I5 TaxID=3042266 RepID=UPI0027D88CA2|nr:BTAD domain-containing putative transcriptional regulator [Arthrobacter sp. B2I5]
MLRFWQLRRDGEIVHVAVRQQRLITVLAVRGPSLRNYVAGLLWPDCPEPRAMESLRVSVHLVTRQIPGILAKEGSTLALDPVVQVDLYRVRALLQESSAGVGPAQRALLDLRDAELLPGWYEDWVLFEQSRLQQHRLRALTTLSRSLLQAGDCEAAAETAAAALEIEPLYEGAVRALVTADLGMENSVSALHAYNSYAAALRRDMGVLPSEALMKLIGAVPAYSPLLASQPLAHSVEDFLPVHGGEAAVLPVPLAVGDPRTEALLAVGFAPRADH